MIHLNLKDMGVADIKADTPLHTLLQTHLVLFQEAIQVVIKAHLFQEVTRVVDLANMKDSARTHTATNLVARLLLGRQAHLKFGLLTATVVLSNLVRRESAIILVSRMNKQLR